MAKYEPRVMDITLSGDCVALGPLIVDAINGLSSSPHDPYCRVHPFSSDIRGLGDKPHISLQAYPNEFDSFDWPDYPSFILMIDDHWRPEPGLHLMLISNPGGATVDRSFGASASLEEQVRLISHIVLGALAPTLLDAMVLLTPTPREAQEARKVFAEVLRESTEYALRQLSPRDFERFTADILTRKGFTVELTPAQKDGGIDILAWHEHALGRMLFAVECKHWSPSNPVDVTVVRGLLGAAELHSKHVEHVNACAVFTTSRFTEDAEMLARQNANLIYLHDIKQIEEWLTALKAGKKLK